MNKTTPWKKHVVGTTSRTRLYAKAEFSRITPKGKACFKIGRVFYFLNTTLLPLDETGKNILKDITPGALVEIEFLSETSLTTSRITKMYLTNCRLIEQNFDLNVGVIYGKDETHLQLTVLGVSETSKANVFIMEVQSEFGDVFSIRAKEDVRALKGRVLDAVINLRSTQDLVSFNGTTKAWECYFLSRDLFYKDKNGTVVEKKDEKKFVPVFELGKDWIARESELAEDKETEESEEV